MTEDKLKRSLYALGKQEGLIGSISINTVAMMLQLRDERIRDLSEFQMDVLLERRRRAQEPPP